MGLIDSLPRGLVVFLGLVLGLVVIFLAQPPHTPCQSQFEVFQNSQKGFIFPDPEKPYITKSAYRKAVEVCKYGNSAGACLDFFNGVRKLHRDLEAVPSECASEVIENEAVTPTLWNALELMVQLAWGARPPVAYVDRQGWFDTYHLTIYCDLKQLLISSLGQEAMSAFIERQLTQLPGAAQMPRTESWQKTILSIPCH